MYGSSTSMLSQALCIVQKSTHNTYFDSIFSPFFANSFFTSS